MANLQKPSLYFYLGLVAIIAGFVCLRTPPVDGVWTLTIAPVLLVLGFVVLVPYGLWPRSRQNSPRSDYPADSEAVTITNLTGLGVFAFSLIIYLLTLWPGPGWWDSSNYILCSYTLGVTSPPGSILLQLLGRLASFFTVISSPAVRINGLVAVVSALSATVVYFTTIRLVHSLDPGKKQAPPAALIGGVLAALTLAFTHSVWSHATFTNPYALSLLSGSLMIYLAVRWWENPDATGAGNFLLLAAFLFGLDMSVHRSNLLLALAFFLLVFLRRPRAFLDFRLWTAGVLLFALGLSMQLTVMFRAQLSPAINLGNPDNWSSLWNYLTLSQFGIKTFGSDLLQRKGSFWDYQIKEMYLRYFGWNFVGMDGQGSGVRWTGLWGIPVLSGIAGLVYHFARSAKQAIFLLAAFLLASLGAIFYLNVPAGFFREMDRHFLVSFMLFSIWIGIGSYAVLRLVSRVFANRSGAVWILAGVLFLVLPTNVLLANWSNNNQNSNHTSYNFGCNLLETCEPDAILITAGDSDTFLSWYLQMIEGIRPDVTVLNLPLLNTSWYLRTIISYHSDLPWTLNEDSLKDLRIIPWETDTVTIIGSSPDSVLLSIVVEPTIAGKYLLIQDQVLLNILRHNRFKRPIYFSAGFGKSLPLNLREHSRLDGLAWRMVPHIQERSDYQRLEDNLLHRYDYEGFGEQTFLDRTGKNMASMYRAAFAHLAGLYRQKGEPEKLDSLEAKFDDLWLEAGETAP
jgi:hypothetical protein